MARDTYDDTPRPRRGISLAKGPVALIGIASLALGVLGFIFADQSFTFDAPSGTVEGSTFIGIEGNGWTWLLFAAAGLLLMLGSPVHWGAKSMAFIVGVALVVGALIALSDGTDILGIFATNNWTKLVMGAGGGALIVLSMLPRVGCRRGGPPPTARRDRELENRDERDPPLRARARPQRPRDDHPGHARGPPLEPVDRPLDLASGGLRPEARQAPCRPGVEPRRRVRARRVRDHDVGLPRRRPRSPRPAPPGRAARSGTRRRSGPRVAAAACSASAPRPRSGSSRPAAARSHRPSRPAAARARRRAASRAPSCRPPRRSAPGRTHPSARCRGRRRARAARR